MEFLTNLLDNTSVPWISAMLLGFLTAISPCPLATNITAIGFISRNVEDRRKVFLNGAYYALGRVITYTILALVILFGADQIELSGFFQRYGEKIVGPLLLLIGLLMLDVIKLNLPVFSSLTAKFEKKIGWKHFDALLLGLVLALAFCPYSGVLYFGILIPLSVSSPSGLFLPVIFAAATAVPVMIFAWLLAFTIGSVSSFYNRLRTMEVWFRRVAAALFILTGIYYIIRIYIINYIISVR